MMTALRRADPATLLALLLGLGSLLMPFTRADATLAVPALPAASGPLLLALAAAWLLLLRPKTGITAAGATAAALLCCWLAIAGVQGPDMFGEAGGGFWLFLAGTGFLVWRALAALSLLQPVSLVQRRLLFLLVPALFGGWLLTLWQTLVTGLGVPQVLLPAPTVIASALSGATPTLAADFVQTVAKSAVPGYLMGCGAGFLVALLADRSPFLKRGLTPIGNLVSAIPIVGIAPIMVMWFGFDWQSKAAVVVIMTFFPMLVNSVAGLSATGRMELDLMRSWAASPWQTLFFLRLPNALPFIFNALKINSTLALIGAIVAEFFGTPIVGMGFRIATEVGRMNVALVWATIAVAALTGSVFYGSLVLLERYTTGWHPSFRGKR